MTENEEFEFKATNQQGEDISSLKDYTGFARVQFSNGDTFSGDYSEGVRKGQGIYTFKKGGKFEGNFCNNKFEGKGKIQYDNGAYYHGYFKNGLKEGEGLYFYSNGDRYSGQWSQDKKNGKGVYIKDSNNMRLKGVWKEGVFVEGQWILSNGDYYEGQFENEFPKGQGKWYKTQGICIEGEYVQKVNKQIEKIDNRILNPIYNQQDTRITSEWITSQQQLTQYKLIIIT